MKRNAKRTEYYELFKEDNSISATDTSKLENDYNTKVNEIKNIFTIDRD